MRLRDFTNRYKKERDAENTNGFCVPHDMYDAIWIGVASIFVSTLKLTQSKTGLC